MTGMETFAVYADAFSPSVVIFRFRDGKATEALLLSGSRWSELWFQFCDKNNPDVSEVPYRDVDLGALFDGNEGTVYTLVEKPPLK